MADSSEELLFQPRPIPAAERSLGNVRLLHELGAGGMATLYLALDEAGCLVAVKRLHPHLAAERQFVEMFRDEANIAARIVHPNVCKVRGLEEHEGHLYILMEYVHGESLAVLLRQLSAAAEALPVEVAVHLVGQACLGLHAAHELAGEDGRPLHVVHRDVSPSNLLVTYDGELKIVDFGIAAAVAKLHQTETGTIKGKLAYMAPEQARGDAVDRRADLFSLGVVLYEAVCGTRCFGGTNVAQIVQRVQEVELVPPRAHRPDLPAGVEQIIGRALTRRPEVRYSSAEEMYRDLYAWLASSTGMTTRRIGDLMRRVFARRLALREELTALAFSAPEVLEEEELTLTVQHALGVPAGVHCEYCGAALAGQASLEAHLERCAQHAWWQRNFGGPRGVEGAGDAADLRRLYARTTVDQTPQSMWQRIRRRVAPQKRDPLVVRLEGIQQRLGAVRDVAAARGADRAMAAFWGIVAEISEKSPTASTLLARIKPALLRCANVLLGITLEIEADAAYLASSSDRELQEQVDVLTRRLSVAPSQAVAREIERNIRQKRALVAERSRVSQLRELLLLRLESMVGAIELTHAKILQIGASPVAAQLEATTQITVFVDSLLREVEQLGDAIREDEAAPSHPYR